MASLILLITTRQEHPHAIEGADRELRKSRDATHLATDGPAPRRYDGRTTAARVRAAVQRDPELTAPAYRRQ